MRILLCYSSYVAVGSSDRYNNYRTYASLRWIVHPDYTGFSRSGVGYFGNLNDIALVQINGLLNFNNTDTVKPACLPNEHVNIHSYSRCYITGWGQIDPEYRKYIYIAQCLRKGGIFHFS